MRLAKRIVLGNKFFKQKLALMHLEISSSKTVVNASRKRLVISNEKTTKSIHISRISSITVGQGVLLNSSALLLAAENNVPLVMSSKSGGTKARVLPRYSKNLASLRYKQLLFCNAEERIQWIKKILTHSNHQKQQCLATHQTDKNRSLVTEIITKIEALNTKIMASDVGAIEETKKKLLGLEGNAGKLYWKGINYVLPEEVQINGRSRRPAKDIFNAAINYAYGMLYGLIENAVLAKGLEPTVAYLHAEGYQRPSLVFDLIEPFRPFVDSLVISLFKDAALNKSCFRFNNGVSLNTQGKKVLIPIFYAWIHTKVVLFGNKLSVKDHTHKVCDFFSKQCQDYESNSSTIL